MTNIKKQVIVAYEMPNRKNGAKEYSFALIEELLRRGYDVSFLCADCPGFKTELPINVIPIPSKRRKQQGGEEVFTAKLPLVMLKKLTKRFAQKIADDHPNLELVIVNGNYPYANVALEVKNEINRRRKKSGNFHRVKSAVILHSLLTQYLRTWNSHRPGIGALVAEGWKLLSSTIAKRFDLVVALSEAVKSEVYWFVPTTFVRTGIRPITLPIETKEDLRTRLGIPQNSISILCPGRVGKEKGSDRNIRVALRAAGLHPNLYFYFVGPGDLDEFRSYTMELAKEYSDKYKIDPQSADRIFFMDSVSRETLIDWMKACDCALYCCPTDNAPWIVYEQLQSGRLLVGVDRAGMKAACGPTACLLADGASDQELDDNCLKILLWLLDPKNSTKVAHITREGISWAEEHTIEHHVRNLLKILESL